MHRKEANMVCIYINGVPAMLSVGPNKQAAFMNALALMDPFQPFQGSKKSRRKR
jgi:hypothetical protein